MQDNEQEQPTKADKRSHFQQEMAVISFQELQKFFAKGMLIEVSTDLDLVDVAIQIHEDNTAKIQSWLDQSKIGRAQDEQAKKWVAQRTEFNAVTVAPWVLVQSIPL